MGKCCVISPRSAVSQDLSRAMILLAVNVATPSTSAHTGPPDLVQDSVQDLVECPSIGDIVKAGRGKRREISHATARRLFHAKSFGTCPRNDNLEHVLLFLSSENGRSLYVGLLDTARDTIVYQANSSLRTFLQHLNTLEGTSNHVHTYTCAYTHMYIDR